MTIYEIPTGPSQRVMTVTLGPTVYTLRLAYADAPDAGWFMDLSDSAGTSLVCGVPLVTGADLVAQLTDLGIGGGIFVATDQTGSASTYEGMGTQAHLLFADMSSLPAVLDSLLLQFTPVPTIYSGVIGAMGIGVGAIGREI